MTSNWNLPIWSDVVWCGAIWSHLMRISLRRRMKMKMKMKRSEQHVQHFEEAGSQSELRGTTKNRWSWVRITHWLTFFCSILWRVLDMGNPVQSVTTGGYLMKCGDAERRILNESKSYVARPAQTNKEKPKWYQPIKQYMIALFKTVYQISIASRHPENRPILQFRTIAII